MNNREQMYFDWLLSKLDGLGRSHRNLALELWLVNFTAVIPLDENRGEDAVRLREVFESESGVLLDGVEHAKYPNILEVLIALSVRMDNSAECGVSVAYGEILRNLGLTTFSDRAGPIRASDRRMIRGIIAVFLSRAYDSYGRGGPFPLREKPKRNWDSRDVELWYQMMAYIDENY